MRSRSSTSWSENASLTSESVLSLSSRGRNSFSLILISIMLYVPLHALSLFSEPLCMPVEIHRLLCNTFGVVGSWFAAKSRNRDSPANNNARYVPTIRSGPCPRENRALESAGDTATFSSQLQPQILEKVPLSPQFSHLPAKLWTKPVAYFPPASSAH